MNLEEAKTLIRDDKILGKLPQEELAKLYKSLEGIWNEMVSAKTT